MSLRDEIVEICFSSDRWEEGYEERLNEEMNHITAGEYEPYYLALYHRDEKVETRRHLTAYLMGISDDFDPDLTPEESGDMPDIDIDFSDRKKVMEYLKGHYGEEYVSYINNYTKLKGKSAVRDVARVMEITIPQKLEDIMTEGGDDWSVSAFYEDLDEELSSELGKDVVQILERAKRLEGNIRQMGVTAAGAIISSVPVEEYTSLYINKDKEIVSVFDKRDVESIGFIKFDILLVKNIAVIQEAMRLVEERGGTLPENIWDIPYDSKMMREFRQAHTSLIFQYQGKALRGYLPDLKPNTIEDLVAATALCRPGADGETYARRKNGEEKVRFLHPSLEPILGDTYGCIVYQEQIMSICRDIAGMMHKDVERVRKMIGKKDTSEAPELKEFFVRGCRRYGLPDHIIDKIWAEILKSGDYSFNRSHSVAYFLIGWANMYLQVHHPLEWILANLIVADDDTKKITIFSEAKRLGVEIGYVDVNLSEKDWSYRDEILIPGLSAVPGVGPKAAEEIATRGYYDSYETLERKVPKRFFNKTVKAALSDAGAIPGVEGDKIFQALSSGHPVDITEEAEIHPAWNPRPVSELSNEPVVVHGYLLSTKKVKRDYQLNIIGDDAITLYHSSRLDSGPYLFLVDSFDFGHVYYACPLDKAHRHPVYSKKNPPAEPFLKKNGPGVAFLGTTKKTRKGKFVSLVMSDTLLTLWLDRQYDTGYYVFEKKGKNYVGTKERDWTARRDRYKPDRGSGQ